MMSGYLQTYQKAIMQIVMATARRAGLQIVQDGSTCSVQACV